MHRTTKLKTILAAGPLILFLLSTLFLFSGCPSAHNFTLYLFSTYTGNVYTFDLQSNTCSLVPVFNYNTDAGDSAYFYGGKGYIAAASFTDPKLLMFDPAASTITSSAFVFDAYEWMGGPSSIVFLGPTKAYVTDSGSYDVDFNPNNDGGVIIFDPSDTRSTWTKIAGIEANCQGMVYIASKNKVYVANSGSSTVFVINTTTDLVDHEITVAENPKSIVALDDGSKIYVGCYNANEIWEVDTSTDVAKSIISETSETWAMAIEDTKVYYSGWFSGPCYIDVSEESPTETPITTKKGSGANLLIYNNKLYMSQPDFAEGQSTLTVVDLSDNSEINGSPFNVGTEGDAITGLAVY